MHKETFTSLQRILFLVVLFGVSVLFIWVLRPFAVSVFWALVLSIVLHPLFLALETRFNRPTLAALLTILIALLVLCIPLYVIGARTAQEGLALYHRVSSGDIDFHAVANSPFVVKTLNSFGVDPVDLADQVRSLANSLGEQFASQALALGAKTADVFLKIGITLYLLFFFLRDGRKLGRYVQRLIPFGDAREQLLYDRFASTTRAVFKGTLIVALVQGLIGGILFFIAGIGSPVLWTVFMAFCATIPAVGSFIVWLPAALILLATGQIWQGMVVLLGGVLVVGTIDNVLRPILVGRDIQMPDALVLLAILGGVATFGISGIIVGPVIGALFISIWDHFGKDFSEELATHG